jgi:transcriptional regulator with XRE-family HTH domain
VKTQPDTETKHRVEMKSLGATIRLLREVKGLSATAFASTLGVDKSYVSLLESDTRKPSVELLNKIANTLGVPLDFLVQVVTERPQADCEITGILDEFDELERRLNRVLSKVSRRTKTS